MAARVRRNQVVIKPFWDRLPRFFLYPLTPPGLYVLVGLAVLNAVLLDVFEAGPGGVVVGIVLSLLAALFSIKYGYDILEQTAHGHPLPPRLDRATLLHGYELPFKQFAVFFLLGLMAFGLALVWPPAMIAFLIAAAMLLPAMVMTLALERSVFAALNPATLFGIAFRVGWAYLAVLALLLLLNGGSGTAMALFGQGLPLPVPARAFLGAFTQNFFGFAMMNLMGYLIYQYHNRLGFSPETLEQPDDGWGALMAPVREDIDAGDYASAVQRLQTLIREYPDDAVDLRQRCHQVLKLGDQEQGLIENAGHLLGPLIDAHRLREATEIYIDITAVDPDIRPGRAGDYEPLLQMLVQRGEYRRAVRMANGFHKAFPDSEAIPALYLEVARVFSEHLHQPIKVRQIADYLIKRFPDHPASSRARTLRDAVTG